MIKIYEKPWSTIRMILISAAFVALATLLLIDGKPEDKMLMWFVLIFFGLGIPIGIQELRTRKPQVIITANNLSIEPPYLSSIAWEKIQHIEYQSSFWRNTLWITVSKTHPAHQYKSIVDNATEENVYSTEIHRLHVNKKRLIQFLKKMNNSSLEQRKTLIKEQKLVNKYWFSKS